MADVVESEIASSSDLDLIIDVLPPELEDVETRYLGDPSVMSPSAMAQFIQAQKRLAKTRSSDSESARLQRYP